MPPPIQKGINQMLVINKYTCPNRLITTTQAHELDENFNVINTFPQIKSDDLSLYKAIDNVLLICEVSKVSKLASIELIKV